MAHLSDREIQALFREACRILHSKEDAEDVVQETLLKGATKCHQLKDESKVFPWMFSIVRREAMAYYKRFSLHTLWAQAKLMLFQPTEAEEGPDARVIRDHERQCLLEALESLTSPAKEIVYMHIKENMNFPQIAQRLNMNYHTFTTLLVLVK